MLNSLNYQGRLTADPELKQTQSGVEYLNFTVAWSEKYKDIEKKCFLPCKAWRGTAKFISDFFGKGKEIVVEGELNTEEWDDKDGQHRSRIILAVDKAHFCGSKTNNAGSTETAQNGSNSADFEEVGDEEELLF